jgi:hypothetical protein
VDRATNDKLAGLRVGELVSIRIQQPSSAIFADGFAPWAC